MATKKKPAKLNSNPLAALTGQAQLMDLRLASSRTILAIPNINSEQGVQQLNELEQTLKVQSGKAESENGPHILCLLTCTIRAGVNAETQMPALLIQAAFALAYRFDSLDETTQEQIQEFGQRNALYNVWPYWREFVQSMTTRMGLPPLRVPLLSPQGLKFTADRKPDTEVPTKKTKKKPRR